MPGDERAHPVCFSIGNKGYVACGKKTVGNYKNDTWEYDPITNAWIQKGSLATFGRTVAVAFSINGMGYCGSGVDINGVELNDFWEYDPSTGQWTQVATIMEATGRHGAASFAINNKGYIGTGLNGTIYKKDIWEYWPVNNPIIVKEVEKNVSEINIYPNPAFAGLPLTISNINCKQEIDIFIYDFSGKLVFENKYKCQTAISIELNSFSKGSYFVLIYLKEENEFQNKKLIVIY